MVRRSYRRAHTSEEMTGVGNSTIFELHTSEIQIVSGQMQRTGTGTMYVLNPGLNSDDFMHCVRHPNTKSIQSTSLTIISYGNFIHLCIISAQFIEAIAYIYWGYFSFS